MFRMPPITKNLLVINILLFLASSILKNQGIDLNNALGLHFFKSDSFMVYQLVTYMFMHANLEHIFFNMLAFWMFGRVLEQTWGAKRYLIFYLVCGIGAGLCQEVVQYIDYMRLGLDQYDMITDGVNRILVSDYLSMWTTVGASGAVYGILLGFGMMFPNLRVLLLIPPIPIKAKYLVMGYAVIELLSGLGSSNSNVAHFAHLGGMLFGFIMIMMWRKEAQRTSQGYYSWDEYRPKNPSLWDRIKSWWAGVTTPKPKKRTSERTSGTQTRQDTQPTSDPLAERRSRQEEIDRILDKVKKSGYSTLTEQEKKTLFDFRNKG